MLLIIAINGAVIVPYLQTMGWRLVVVIATVLVHVVATYFIGYVFGSVFFPGDPDKRISIAYISAMRNNSAGIAIAMAHFPPLVAVPVILSILLQQPAAGILRILIQKKQHTVELTVGAD